MPDQLALAVSAINAAELVGDDQEVLRARIVEFCRAHPNPLERACLEGHLTASALVVDPEREMALLIHHAKLDRWLQPGGHVDGEGDLAAAALREAEEEVGILGLRIRTPAIDLDIHEIPERGAEPAHLHLDVRFLVVAPSGAEPSINHESHDARWVPRHDPDGLIASDELRRLVHRGLDLVAQDAVRQDLAS